ncbi:MAG TPA: basic secretory protein-like protein [Verrucomicrobiae bacterium]
MKILVALFLAVICVTAAENETGHRTVVETEKYVITIDSSEAPDLCGWVETKLRPVVKEWYPKLVEMLPSEGYEAPTNVVITLDKDAKGVAYAAGSKITCAVDWFRKNLEGEAVGAVVHEMVHVVQNYGWGRRNTAEGDRKRTPGWIVEGIPDYIRWFLYEPETKGAEITARNLSRAKYDANYRISGNFINWVVEKYDKDVVKKINAAARAAKYSDDLWKEYTGKTIQELGDEWRGMHEERLKSAEAKSE